MSDDESAVAIVVAPTVVDAAGALPPGVAFDVAIAATGLSIDAVQLPLAVPASVEFRPFSVAESPSFFVDQEFHGELALTPSQPCTNVVGSTIPIVLRIEAPFKRLLMYLACGFGAMFLLGVAWFLVARAGADHDDEVIHD